MGWELHKSCTKVALIGLVKVGIRHQEGGWSHGEKQSRHRRNTDRRQVGRAWRTCKNLTFSQYKAGKKQVENRVYGVPKKGVGYGLATSWQRVGELA